MKKTRKLFTTLMLIMVAAVMLTTSAYAASVEATVNSHMLNVREGKGMEYTIIDVLYEGNTVKVVKDDGSGWVKVKVNGQTGWVNKLFLTFKENKPAEEPAVAEEVTIPEVTVSTGEGSKTGKVTGDGVYMRSGPSTSSSILDTLSKGTKVKVNGICGQWYEVNKGGTTGYIHTDYVKVSGKVPAATVSTGGQETAPTATPKPTAKPKTTPKPTAKPKTTPKPTAKPKTTPKPTATPKVSATGQAIVDTAMKYIGTPYVWAGTSPEEGFDCSGLVYYCYKVNGITINRVAQSMYYNGKGVNLDKLKPGDILLFGSSVYNIWHAGMYVGNGQFIHSPHSGASVRVENLSDLYGMRLVSARRVV